MGIGIDMQMSVILPRDIRADVAATSATSAEGRCDIADVVDIAPMSWVSLLTFLVHFHDDKTIRKLSTGWAVASATSATSACRHRRRVPTLGDRFLLNFVMEIPMDRGVEPGYGALTPGSRMRQHRHFFSTNGIGVHRNRQ
jgi:hypothetical protein